MNLINLLKYVNFPPAPIRRSVIIKGTVAGDSKHRDLKSNPSTGSKIVIDEEVNIGIIGEDGGFLYKTKFWKNRGGKMSSFMAKYLLISSSKTLHPNTHQHFLQHCKRDGSLRWFYEYLLFQHTECRLLHTDL